MEFHTGNPLLSRPRAYLFLARLRESLTDGPLEKLWGGGGGVGGRGIFEQQEFFFVFKFFV